MSSQNKIGLGSVQFGLPYGISNKGGQTPVEEVIKILNSAYESGIRFIDTAAGYGSSESVIGSLHNNRFSMVTKFGPSESATNLRQQIAQSLAHLGTDSVYGYLAHRPMDLLANRNVWQELLQLKAEGKVNKIGFSLNSPNEYTALRAGGMEPDLVQVPFNYFDTRFRETMVKLKSKGCEVHTRSTFLQGLFFTDPKELSPFFDDLKPMLVSLQQKYREGLEGVLLAYVLHQSFVDTVIMGVETEKQLQLNLDSCKDVPILEDLEINFSEKLLMPMHWPKN